MSPAARPSRRRPPTPPTRRRRPTSRWSRTTRSRTLRQMAQADARARAQAAAGGCRSGRAAWSSKSEGDGQVRLLDRPGFFRAAARAKRTERTEKTKKRLANLAAHTSISVAAAKSLQLPRLHSHGPPRRRPRATALRATPRPRRRQRRDARDEDLLRRSLHLKAFLLPEPFSPEASAYFSEQGSQRPGQPDNWERALGDTPRAARQARDRSELFNDALSVLGALRGPRARPRLGGEFSSSRQSAPSSPQPVRARSAASSWARTRRSRPWSTASSAPAWNASSSRSSPRRPPRRCAPPRRPASAGQRVPSRRAAHRGERRPLRRVWAASAAARRGARPHRGGVPRAHTRAAMVHRAFETQQGSGLASFFVDHDRRPPGRCAPPQLPPPPSSVPRSSRPLRDTRAAACARPRRCTAPSGRPRCGEGPSAEADAARGSRWDRRFLVAWADTTRGSAVPLTTECAAGVRTQLACSPSCSTSCAGLFRPAWRPAVRIGRSRAAPAVDDLARPAPLPRAQPVGGARRGAPRRPRRDGGAAAAAHRALRRGGHARRAADVPEVAPRSSPRSATARRSGRSTSWWIWREWEANGFDEVVSKCL